MLKITAIGNLTHDVELKMNETTGKPYAILRIASDRRYKDKDGNKLTDFTGPQEKHWTKQVGTWTTSSPTAAPVAFRTHSAAGCSNGMP